MALSTIFTSDAVVLGLLLMILAAIFYTASLTQAFWRKFYAVFPPLLLCYFIPGLLNSFGIISGEDSKLYSVVSQFFFASMFGVFYIRNGF